MSLSHPYTRYELLGAATSVTRLDPLRVLATYADPANWKQVYLESRCWWAWVGPTIVGYELAGQGVADAEDPQ